ncbi:MAG: hypothetical protein MUE95_12120 [Cyclobacteriaceae bacterium]|nr:hypothetical protein [Cyclobacteriaceae bacterium]
MSNTLIESNLPGLSAHLFWDVDRNSLILDQHQKFIIQRVLEYGTLEDWKALLKIYGRDVITETVQTLRSLDPRALSFIAAFSGLSREKFRCYITK